MASMICQLVMDATLRSAIGPALARKSDQIFEAVLVDDAIASEVLKLEPQRLLSLVNGCERPDDDSARRGTSRSRWTTCRLPGRAASIAATRRTSSRLVRL